MKFFLVVLSFSIAMDAFAQDIDKVIYGQDNRHEVDGYPRPEIVAAARSTVALLKASSLMTSNGRTYFTSSNTFSDNHKLCPGERFANQLAMAFCSGFLVAPNKIMTAGHCVRSVKDCEQLRLVFDYRMSPEGIPNGFSGDQVYSCKRVIGWKMDTQGADFSIVELDRPVVGRQPLRLSLNRNLNKGDEVLVIGHPVGLPTKITDAAHVRKVDRKKGFFVTNLDTYAGNSGSAVFNSRTVEVEGILVRGEKDFVEDTVRDCSSSFVTGENESRGEDVTLISAVSENGTPAPLPPRYIWLPSDSSCNYFVDDNYIREADAAYCGRDAASMTFDARYVWMASDNSCNLFHGNQFVREAEVALCGHDAAGLAPNARYVWLASDNTCNLFNGLVYIREVHRSLCKH